MNQRQRITAAAVGVGLLLLLVGWLIFGGDGGAPPIAVSGGNQQERRVPRVLEDLPLALEQPKPEPVVEPSAPVVVETPAEEPAEVVPAEEEVAGGVTLLFRTEPAVESLSITISHSGEGPWGAGARLVGDPPGSFRHQQEKVPFDRILIRADGYLNVSRSFDALTEGVLDLGTIQLDRGASVIVMVVDEFGGPVAGAGVLVENGAGLQYRPASGVYRHSPNLPTTDANGQVEVSGLVEGPAVVVAGTADQVSRPVSGRALLENPETITVTLYFGGHIFGDLRVPPGTPDPGDEFEYRGHTRKAQYFVRIFDRSQWSGNLPDVVRRQNVMNILVEGMTQVRVTDQWAYRSPLLMPGEYWVATRIGPETVYVEAVVVARRDTRADLVFKGDKVLGTVAGTVTGADGRPLAGATVCLFSGIGFHLGQWDSRADGKTTTDAMGRYELVGVAPGEAAIRLIGFEKILPKTDDPRLATHVRAGQTSTLDIDLRQFTAVGLFLRARFGDEGEPVMVSYLLKGNHGTSSTAKEDGWWRYPGLEAGRYSAYLTNRVKASNGVQVLYEQDYTHRIDYTPSEEDQRLDLVVPVASISGSVPTVDPASSGPVIVRARMHTGRNFQLIESAPSVTADENGRYLFPALVQGRYLLEVLAPGRVAVSREIELTADAEFDFPSLGPPGGSLLLAVRSVQPADGIPETSKGNFNPINFELKDVMGNRILNISRGSPTHDRSHVVATVGSSETFDGIPPGNYTLTVRPMFGEPIELMEVTILVGQATKVELDIWASPSIVLQLPDDPLLNEDTVKQISITLNWEGRTAPWKLSGNWRQNTAGRWQMKVGLQLAHLLTITLHREGHPDIVTEFQVPRGVETVIDLSLTARSSQESDAKSRAEVAAAGR